MSYLRRSGAHWARKHPKGSAIMGIIFGSFFVYVGYLGIRDGASPGWYILLAAIAYIIYCLVLLFK